MKQHRCCFRSRDPPPPHGPPFAGCAAASLGEIDDDDGIVVYRREIPGSPVIAFKGEGDINASILRVASVLVDTSRATEWIDSLTECKTLKQIGEGEYHRVRSRFERPSS